MEKIKQAIDTDMTFVGGKVFYDAQAKELRLDLTAEGAGSRITITLLEQHISTIVSALSSGGWGKKPMTSTIKDISKAVVVCSQYEDNHE